MVVLKATSEVLKKTNERFPGVLHPTSLAIENGDKVKIKTLLKSESERNPNEKIELEICEFGLLSRIAFEKGQMSAPVVRKCTEEEKEAFAALLQRETEVSQETELQLPVTQETQPELTFDSDTGFLIVSQDDNPFLETQVVPEVPCEGAPVALPDVLVSEPECEDVSTTAEEDPAEPMPMEPAEAEPEREESPVREKTLETPQGGDKEDEEKPFKDAPADRELPPMLKEVPDTSFTAEDVSKKLEAARKELSENSGDCHWTITELERLCESDSALCQYIMREGKSFLGAYRYFAELCRQGKVGVSTETSGGKMVDCSRESATQYFIEYFKVDDDAVKALAEEKRKKEEEERKAREAASKTKKKTRKKSSDKPAEPVAAPSGKIPAPVTEPAKMETPPVVAPPVAVPEEAPATQAKAPVKLNAKNTQQISFMDLL